MGTGRATTRAHSPHPLPARPYYTADRPVKLMYGSGPRGCPSVLRWLYGLTTMPVLGKQVEEDALLRMLPDDILVELHTQSWPLR